MIRVIISCICYSLLVACKDSPSRTFHLINLSLPKTGSTSVASIFANYRSMHEGLHIETVSAILDFREGRLTASQIDDFLLRRDELMEYPYVDSATFLHFVTDRLVTLFPRAKFLICVRNGEDWIVSLVSMLVQYFGPRGFMTRDGYLPPGIVPQGYIGQENPGGIYIRDFADRYGRVFSRKFSRQAFSDLSKLRMRTAAMLDDFAQFWGERTLRSLAQVPTSRRLVLRTSNLSLSVGKLADFVGIPAATLRQQDSHKNRDPDFEKIRNLLGRDNLQRAVKPWQVKVEAALSSL